MSTDDKVHSLELRMQAAENRHSSLKGILIGALIFLGLGGAAGWYNLYQRTLQEAQLARVEAALTKIDNLAVQAQTDATRIKSAIKDVCADPKWVDKTGQCIFHANPGRYALNYGAAAAYCTAKGARLCTRAELNAAQQKGAEWCSWGWVADLSRGDSNFDMRGQMAFPMQSGRSGCGNKAGVIERLNIHVLEGNAGANCCI